MFNTRIVRVIRRAALSVAVGSIVHAAHAPLGAQQTSKQTKQQRDSAARADSAKHAGMAGMAGMKMPAKAPTATPKTQSPDKAVPVAKDAAPMKGMAGHTDSASMKAMPVMHDSAAMKAMPGMGDSSMKAMPGMRDTTSMKAMPGMHDSASMKAMPGMRDSASMSPMKDTMAMQRPSTMMVADPLGVSMDRMGSGTTWIPDAVSIPSRHYMAGHWDLMLHGFVFVQENVQGGPRGSSQFGSLNWGMFMASHELAGGRFQARTMLSLDAATVTPRGYPLLLQTGEAFQGVGLHDRQHPHDFLMELGAVYERPITKAVGLSLYGAPSGEPALGPVAFMHRPSAMDMPVAPITHHWQDATHVSFGVLTAGLFGHSWKLEGSYFNGREPDENRWDIDPIKLDSYSGRLTLNPTANWSLTGGYGYIKSHDALDPTQSMHRITASAIHGAPIGTDGQWSSTVVWGVNRHPGQAVSHGVLAESEAILDRHNTILGRVTYVQEEAGDLAVDTPPLNFPADRLFNVGSAGLGFIRELARWQGTTIGLGLMGTVNLVPSALESTYGSRTPVGGLVFLRLRPFHTSGGPTMGGMKMGVEAPGDGRHR